MPLAADLPCVLFALRRESMIFRRAHRPLRCLKPAPCYAALARHPLPLLLVETGIGHRAVAAAFDWLLTAVPHPRWLVFAGFAGALDPALRVGDVVLADVVVDAVGGCWPLGLPAKACSGVRRGRLFTTDQLVATPQEKRRLASAYSACMVDMEAAHAAMRCASAAIPFYSIRAISDSADTSLSPALVTLLSAGRVSALRLAGAVCRTPSLVRELWRLGRDTHIAARRLASALDTLLGTLAPLPNLGGTP